MKSSFHFAVCVGISAEWSEVKLLIESIRQVGKKKGEITYTFEL